MKADPKLRICYVSLMTKLLEEAIERVKALPEPDQDVAAEFLLGFADSDRMRYRISDKQLREVEIAKDEARHGKFASQADMDSLWRRSGQ